MVGCVGSLGPIARDDLAVGACFEHVRISYTLPDVNLSEGVVARRATTDVTPDLGSTAMRDGRYRRSAVLVDCGQIICDRRMNNF